MEPARPPLTPRGWRRLHAAERGGPTPGRFRCRAEMRRRRTPRSEEADPSGDAPPDARRARVRAPAGPLDPLDGLARVLQGDAIVRRLEIAALDREHASRLHRLGEIAGDGTGTRRHCERRFGRAGPESVKLSWSITSLMLPSMSGSRSREMQAGRRAGLVATHEDAHPIARIAGFRRTTLRRPLLLIGNLGFGPLAVRARHRGNPQAQNENTCRRQPHLIPSRRKRVVRRLNATHRECPRKLNGATRGLPGAASTSPAQSHSRIVKLLTETSLVGRSATGRDGRRSRVFLQPCSMRTSSRLHLLWAAGISYPRRDDQTTQDRERQRQDAARLPLRPHRADRTQLRPRVPPGPEPKRMLALGVFCGKYMTDCRKRVPRQLVHTRPALARAGDCSLNCFGVDASQPLSVWRRKGWIHPDDPRGWFQWYCRYYMGRRLPDEDARQIRRWMAMRRHVAQIGALRARRSDVPTPPAPGPAALGL